MHRDLDHAGEVAVARIAGHDEAEAARGIERLAIARPGDERVRTAAGRDFGERQRDRAAVAGGERHLMAHEFGRRKGDAADMIEQRPQRDAEPGRMRRAMRGLERGIARRPRQGLQLGEGEAARRIDQAADGQRGLGLRGSGRGRREREEQTYHDPAA